ncbi:MAG TPA: hypothetical protein VGG46_01840 [Terriglobales bacterium]
MSIAGILSSSLFNFGSQGLQNTNLPSHKPQFQQEFEQLGQDLKSGDVPASQSVLTTLQQGAPQPNSASLQSGNTISQAFAQLSQDLQSGNVTAAQQAYASIQQNAQTQGTQQMHHHHHHGGGGASSSNQQNPIDQLFSELGQDLQSGNVSAAQDAYSSMQQDFAQFGENMSLMGAVSSGVQATA